ncbi:uncharacterized protein LOC131930324 [Physella acuta]|uniref:uncharacterized protein LOC131930324 n=1 Tax=Physella acuta TaxID=109671 RepID=UPI0027DE417A|nr:uncharacterized protein LOC131930324 [Physella acuta]
MLGLSSYRLSISKPRFLLFNQPMEVDTTIPTVRSSFNGSRLGNTTSMRSKTWFLVFIVFTLFSSVDGGTCTFRDYWNGLCHVVEPQKEAQAPPATEAATDSAMQMLACTFSACLLFFAAVGAVAYLDQKLPDDELDQEPEEETEAKPNLNSWSNRLFQAARSVVVR